MKTYILQRFIQMIIVMLVVMLVSFIIVELPPGDFLTTLREQLTEQNVDPKVIDSTVEMYRGALRPWRKLGHSLWQVGLVPHERRHGLLHAA